MPSYTELSHAELQAMKEELLARYSGFQEKKLALDMTRGKPSPEQLDLAMEMLTGDMSREYRSPSGVDCRNYGGLEGIREARELFAEYLGVAADEIIVGDSASLKMMHDTVVGALVYGVAGSDMPWGRLDKVKFLCPSPGYDRHFAVCQYLGIEMIPVAMDDAGPDMDRVEELVGADESIKGIWCVPKYSNPTGITYSDTVVERLAAMETRASDFRIFCDNAYAVHHLSDKRDTLKNVLAACREAGNPERVFLYGSTSKISFAGAGVAMMAASRKNIDFVLGKMQFQTIGPNKLNQLHHVLFFKNAAGIESHMAKHGAILKPKFDAVLQVLDRELGGSGIASWSRPQGGYFISIDTLDNCAAAVIEKAAEAGVKLTPAGATFPYGRDERDRNIRIAPSFPSAEDVRTAMELVGICIRLVSIDRLLG
ncbi:MAG: aminotransferase class I/II-fold pyridoxal phosphate-dependent enzyme [Deltaproteobacteria bacterium]|jgi:aspartate/methionine/tyrosine aminotransferase|nr:aminotransferase class I/II-fold pyridoxal phosphate-dependent enzyme [Deltaproteobacteria bacterium]